MTKILDLIRARRSVREFSDRVVQDRVLDDVLAAGRLSPSGGNAQPWLFGVVRERSAIDAMGGDLYAALNLEEHQTKIAGAHMALAALEHGVGSTWVSRFDVEAVADLLGLPDRCLPSELLVMGYPAAPGGSRSKKPIEELVFFDRWTADDGDVEA